MPTTAMNTKRSSLGYRSALLLCLCWLAALILLKGSNTIAISQAQQRGDSQQQINVGAGINGSADFNHGWRHTKFGWQNSANWLVDPYAPQKFVELIHPTIWALLVLTLVLLVTIWATEEWELEQLDARIFRDRES